MRKIILLSLFLVFFYGCKSSMKLSRVTPAKEKNATSQVYSIWQSSPTEFAENKIVDPIYAILGIVGVALFACILLRNRND